MFNDRQLLALELSARIVSETGNERIRNALATNFSDLLRYQNMLCRYDKRALKSLDIFSVHGFPVGLIQCESNFLGIMDPKRDACIGSGGWANIVEKFKKAKSYCDRPFEFKHQGRKKTIVYIDGEWIGDSYKGIDPKSERSVDISCRNAGAAELREGFLDAVFTDPPNGTGSSILDTVFVCRSTGLMRKKWLADTPGELAIVIKQDLDRLRAGNVKPTRGDIRCIAFGHLVRLAIWSLKNKWSKKETTDSRIAKVAKWIHDFGGWKGVENHLDFDGNISNEDMPLFALRESESEYGAEDADVSF